MSRRDPPPTRRRIHQIRSDQTSISSSQSCLSTLAPVPAGRPDTHQGVHATPRLIGWPSIQAPSIQASKLQASRRLASSFPLPAPRHDDRRHRTTTSDKRSTTPTRVWCVCVRSRSRPAHPPRQVLHIQRVCTHALTHSLTQSTNRSIRKGGKLRQGTTVPCSPHRTVHRRR